MIKCMLCGREFEVEQTFELDPKMDLNTGEFYYECPDCCGDIREVDTDTEQEQFEERKETKPDKRIRRASRDRKAFY